MRIQQLIFFIVAASSQSFDLNGLISAGEAAGSGALGLTSDVGPAASLAQSALSSLQPSNTAASTPLSSGRSSQSSSASPEQSASSTSAPSTRSTNSASNSNTASRTSSDASSTSSTPNARTTDRPTDSTSTSSTVTAPAGALAAAAATPSSTAPPSDGGNHRKNQLLEIILPTVLSGLTLLILMALIAWYCMRRRNRQRNRRSGMSHLYGAGSDTDTGYHSPAMEERAEGGLLHRTSSPPLPAAGPHHQGYDVPYPPPHTHGAVEYTEPDHNSHPAYRHAPVAAAGHMSRVSNSTSTNGISAATTSTNGAGSPGNRYYKGPQTSYQPVTTEDNPAELAAGRHSMEGANGHMYSRPTPDTRVRTPPLQAMFPWFGSKSPTRQQYAQPRVSGMHGRDVSLDGPGDFSFHFDKDRRSNASRSSGQRSLGRTASIRNAMRHSIPRKPVPHQ